MYRTCLIGLIITFGAIQAFSQTTSAPVNSIKGIALLTNDRAIADQLRKSLKAGFKQDEVAYRLPPERFVTRLLENGRLVAIDRGHPYLEAKSQDLALVGLLDEYCGKDLSIQVGDVPVSRRAEFVAQIDRMFPEYSRPIGYDVGKAALGLHYSVNVTLTGGDGTTQKTARLPMPRELIESRSKALSGRTMPMRIEPLPQKHLDSIAASAQELLNNRGRMETHCLGNYANRVPEGMRDASELLEETIAELDTSTRKASEKLLGKIGSTPAFDTLPKGAIGIEQLDKSLAESALDQFVNGWQSMGFSSSDLAKTFFNASSKVEVSVSLGLYRSFSSRNQATRTPGTGMVYNFLLIRP